MARSWASTLASEYDALPRPATPMIGTASGSAKARSTSGSRNFVSWP